MIKVRLAGELTFYVAGAEGQWPLDTAGAAFDKYQQTFGRDESTGKFILDVMRVADSGVWELAGHPELTRPWDETIAYTEAGIPYLQPEQVLLYKAPGIGEEDPRIKDGADFLCVLPFLDPSARGWRDALPSALAERRRRAPDEGAQPMRWHPHPFPRVALHGRVVGAGFGLALRQAQGAERGAAVPGRVSGA